MKFYITLIALITGIAVNANAQQDVKLEFKYLPQHHYLSKISMNVAGDVNVQEQSAVADSMKAKGIPPNMKIALAASGNIDITTGAESNGLVPVTMRLDNVTAQPSFNGQNIPLPMATMLNGKAVYGKANADGKLQLDSVSGKQLPDSALNHINQMMSMAMSRMQFPKKVFKPGDTFTQDVPLNMPMKGMPPVNATSKVTYHLDRIANGKAYFNLTQTTSFVSDKDKMHTTMTGNGTGTMIYEVKEHYPSEFNSNMKINVHAGGTDKGGADVMLTIVTSGTTSLSR